MHYGEKMRKMVKYEDFEKTRLEICTAEKMRKIVKYEEFEHVRIKFITTDKNEKNCQI